MRGRCSPSTATRRRSWPAARASCRCWRCGWPAPSTWWTSTGSASSAAVRRDDGVLVRGRDDPARQPGAGPGDRRGGAAARAGWPRTSAISRSATAAPWAAPWPTPTPPPSCPPSPGCSTPSSRSTGPRGTRRIAGRGLLRDRLHHRARAGRAARRRSGSRCGAPGAGFAVEEVARRHGDFALVGAMVAVQVRERPDRAGGHRADRDGQRAGARGGGRAFARRRRRSPTSTSTRSECRRSRPRAVRRRARQPRDTASGSVPPSSAGRSPMPSRRPPMPEIDARPVRTPRSRSSMTVNGRRRRVRVEPRKTLADTLREDLGLTGTHLGCEHGVCGACTILLDGDAVRSCLLFGVQADGAEVTTVEGLATDAALTHAGAASVPRVPRPAVRLLHPRLRRVGDRVPRAEPRPDRRGDPRRGSPATSAAAPATRASSGP